MATTNEPEEMSWGSLCEDKIVHSTPFQANQS